MEVRSLSPTEARVVLAAESEGREELTLDEIQRRARISRSFARKLAHDLVRKHWLQRLRRGRYLLNPARAGPDALPDTDPFRIGSRLVDPYYFGFATAAELHGLLPQAGQVYYLVTTSRTTLGRRFPVEFRLLHRAPARFFGAEPMLRRGTRLFVSDLERTVLDCLDRPALSGGLGGVVGALRNGLPRLRPRRLRAYLARWGDRSLERRVGFLLDRLASSGHSTRRWEIPAACPGEPFVPLGSVRGYGRRGPRDRRWRIIENVPRRELFAEVDHR
jgi:predicted transcriptional regulator of viral defense system